MSIRAGQIFCTSMNRNQKDFGYPVPDDDELLGKAEVFYDLEGSGGDGCASMRKGISGWPTSIARNTGVTANYRP